MLILLHTEPITTYPKVRHRPAKVIQPVQNTHRRSMFTTVGAERAHYSNVASELSILTHYNENIITYERTRTGLLPLVSLHRC